MKTDVVIIGAGPAGLLLSQLLMQAGIATVILERQTRAHVLSRIRAGVLEQGTVDLLDQAGVGARLHREGQVHSRFTLANADDTLDLDLMAAAGRGVTVYGQTEVTKDLYAAQDAQGAQILHEVSAVQISALDTDMPRVTCLHQGAEVRIDARYVAGCDGYHGVSRTTIPEHLRQSFEKTYPFGWLGILSETPPVAPHLVYAGGPRGFALASMRRSDLSRSYIQVPLTDTVDSWSDEDFWEEFIRRMPESLRRQVVTGASIEKSIAPLRSFVSEPMQWQRLFLCGDAAHIVPPTGAKGLNLAVSDVFYLSRALIARFGAGDEHLLARYGADALARVWQAMRFSWQMTMLLHRFPDHSDFDQRLQGVEFALLQRSDVARKQMAEAYTGLPF